MDLASSSSTSDLAAANGWKAQGGSTPGDAPATRSLEHLPQELSLLLITAGVLGLILPGPVGTPFLIAGGLSLWPRGFQTVDGWFRRRFPRLHREGMVQLDRFLNDLERRYPGSTSP